MVQGHTCIEGLVSLHCSFRSFYLSFPLLCVFEKQFYSTNNFYKHCWTLFHNSSVEIIYESPDNFIWCQLSIYGVDKYSCQESSSNHWVARLVYLAICTSRQIYWLELNKKNVTHKMTRYIALINQWYTSRQM